jgi:hypothetical protein
MSKYPADCRRFGEGEIKPTERSLVQAGGISLIVLVLENIRDRPGGRMKRVAWLHFRCNGHFSPPLPFSSFLIHLPSLSCLFLTILVRGSNAWRWPSITVRSTLSRQPEVSDDQDGLHGSTFLLFSRLFEPYLRSQRQTSSSPSPNLISAWTPDWTTLRIPPVYLLVTHGHWADIGFTWGRTRVANWLKPRWLMIFAWLSDGTSSIESDKPEFVRR